MTNNDWQEFLFIKGGVFNNGTISSFGNTEKELSYTQNEDIICDLSHLDILEISGDDALTFLQGQVTNDVKLLRGNNAHYTGYCSPKGRLLALFFAFTFNNNLHLQLNHKLAEPIAKRLKMYVMRSKVAINNVSDSTVKIGLSGHNIAKFMAPIFGGVPSAVYESIQHENATLICLPNAGVPRYEIIAETERAKTIWQSLKTNCKPVGKPCWDWLETQAGIPDIYVNTQEEFVPQMVNLDSLNAINFKKGCYTGQEIVARTHYLGKVKRRTQLAHIATSTPPIAGEDVTQNNEIVGKIVRSAPAPLGGFDVLAETRLEALEIGNIYWREFVLNIKPLPYPLAETSKN
ncbi:MAG TPA: folate-binding protein [Methylotenera sp.]|nr:folate-binding protein [Methylotenera sp.]HPH04261.1 folate-binding protein [Methylotenera sp.]HPM99815.1 folate-binding protein [Methylotenera sp.]